MHTVAVVRAQTSGVAEDYRLALRNVAAAVAVVTTFDEDDQPYGTTVSAFTPLSMDPPLLLVSLDVRSRMLPLVGHGSLIGVNVLGGDQADVGRRFADPTADRWDGIEWAVEAGVPALGQRHAFIGIQADQLIPAGDHTLVVGDVLVADWTVGDPLTYWQRGFGTHRSV